MNTLTDTYRLNNGVEIPCVGFGTWQTPDGDTAVNSVLTALEAGYRHIDTAAIYGNEKGVGEAIRRGGVNREDLFVTSKLWNSDRGYKETLAAFEVTMEKLGLEYLDLYLIHWPAIQKQFADWQEINAQTWKAFEDLYAKGKIRAIGVSNFLPQHLTPLLESAAVKPAVNQIEFHPGYMQAQTVKVCRANDILVEAWSPLGTGRMLGNPDLIALAEKYGVSVARLCIRWCLQNNTLPLPKSVTPERIRENTQVFDFEIAADDMRTINAMPYIGGSGLDPDAVGF